MEINTTINNILVPINFSDSNIKAVNFAAKIALKHNAKLILFHAFYSPAFDLIAFTGNKTVQKQLRIKVTQKLFYRSKTEMLNFMRKARQYEEVKNLDEPQIEFSLKPGLVCDEIESEFVSQSIDLVVMNYKQTKKPHKNATAEKILKTFKTPAFLIPEDIDDNIDITKLSIAHLSVFNESEFFIISYLFKISQILKIPVKCLQITCKKQPADNTKTEGLKQYYKNVYKIDSLQHAIEICDSSFTESIEEYLNKAGINAISFTLDDENISKKILFPPENTKTLKKYPLMIFQSRNI